MKSTTIADQRRRKNALRKRIRESLKTDHEDLARSLGMSSEQLIKKAVERLDEEKKIDVE